MTGLFNTLVSLVVSVKCTLGRNIKISPIVSNVSSATLNRDVKEILVACDARVLNINIVTDGVTHASQKPLGGRTRTFRPKTRQITNVTRFDAN